MLDAVTAALEGDEDEGSAPSEHGNDEAPKAEAAPEKPAAVKESDELSETDMARLSKAAQKRIRSLVSERNKQGAEIAELEPKAKHYDTIAEQIRVTGLDQADLAAMFDIGIALKRGDLFTARQKLEPIFAQVMQLTGGVLPQDLAKDVESKAITAQRAHELATARAAASLANVQGQVETQRREQRAFESARGDMVRTVNAWESQKAASDPDWKLKAPEVHAALELQLRRGAQPRTSADAVAMADEALKQVEAKLRAFRPAPRAVRPTIGSGAASPRNTAEPKSMLDIVNMNMG